MKLVKTFIVLSALFIFLGTSFALAVSATPVASGETSGEIVPNLPQSGEISSGELPSSGEFIDTLASTALNSNFNISKNETLNAAMEASVSGDESFIFVITTEPSNGNVSHTDSTSPSFSYTPNLDFVGSDSFTFRLESGDLYSNVATISITVENDEETFPFYYEDMQEHWANYSASHLAARGLIIGENVGGDFYYHPNQKVTRGEFLLFLLSIINDDDTKPASIEFADEKSIPSWLVKDSKIAYAMGIVKGVGKGQNIYLYPDNYITRAEAFMMINNVLNAKINITDSTDDLTYSDSKELPSWAIQSVKNLTGYKIVQGSDNKINAYSNVSRGDAAELCFKMLKQIEAYELSGNTGGSGEQELK